MYPPLEPPELLSEKASSCGPALDSFSWGLQLRFFFYRAVITLEVSLLRSLSLYVITPSVCFGKPWFLRIQLHVIKIRSFVSSNADLLLAVKDPKT